MLRMAFGLVFLVTSLSGIAADSNTQKQAESREPWLILEKSAFAARELNYEGQFIYINGDQNRTVEIKHMNYGGREVTRNIVLDANRREVYSKGGDVVIFQTNNDHVTIKKRRGKNLFPAMLPTNLSLIKANYSAHAAGTEYVAGREAHVVELMPIDAYRYRYKVWADIKFGLILKMTLLNASDKTLEQIYFKQLSMLNTQNLNWFEPKMDMTKSYVTEANAPIKRVESDWVLTSLPAGYKKVDHIQRAVPSKGTTVDQLIFSDGIASVSVFIEPLIKGQRPKKGHMLMGSTNMCAHVVDGHQVVVVGEVPEKTVQSIAQAVTFKKTN